MPGSGAILAGAAFVKLTLDNAELKRGLEEAQGKVQKFAASVNSFATQMSMVGPLMAIPILSATKAFSAFDDQMRLTAAVSHATGKQLESMTELAKKLGRETSFTAAQVAAGMTALGRMGFNPKEIENAIQPMMNLSRATGTDLATAAEIAANALRAMGMDTSRTEEVVDILTATANGSAQTLTDLGEALKMAIPSARAAGASMTDVNAALGVLANVGIRGSMAGTALKRAYSELVKTDVQSYLRQFNIRTEDSSRNLRNMADILRDCAAAMAKLGSAEKIAFASQVFGERAATSALAMTADVGKIDEMLEKLRNAKGVAQETSDQMDKGLGGAMRRLSSAAEGINIALGEIIATSFTPLIESLSGFFGALRKIIGANSQLVSGMLGLTGTVVGLGMAVKVISMIGSAVKSIFAPLNALQALVSGISQHAITSAGTVAAAENRSAIARLAAMGKVNSAKLFSAALSAKHAKAVLAASNSEIAASHRAVVASKARQAMYYAEAIAAKVAAGATVALKAALDFLLTNAVTISIVAMVAALYAVNRAVNATNESFKKQSESAREAAKAATDALAAGDTKRQKAEVDFTRIKQLEEISARGKLSAQEMADAEKLINNLNPYGSSQWASLDKVTGQLTLAADAQKKFNDEMKKAAELQIQAEIAKLQAEQKALQNENQQLLSYQNHTLLAQFTGRQEQATQKIEENGKRAVAVYMQIAAAQKRLKALRAGDQDAVTGKKEQTSTDKAAEAEQARRASAKELADAEKELARMDEENAKKKMSNLEREIYQINKLKEKYLELANLKKADLQADLKAAQKRMKDNASQLSPAQKAAYDAARKAAESAQSELDALDKRISNAVTNFDAQTAEARRKAAEAQAKAEKKYTGFLDETQQKQQERESEKAQDRQFDELNKNKKTPEGIQALNAFMDQLAGSLEAAKKKYSEMLSQFKAAGSEGGAALSESERSKLDAVQKEITDRMSKLNSYRDRIAEGFQTAQKESMPSKGVFNAADIDALTNGRLSPVEQINKKMDTVDALLSKLITKMGNIKFQYS